MRGPSLVAASGGHSSSRCAGLSPPRPLLLRSTGSRHAGSAIVAHGPSRSAARGILPDQGLNLCPLHWRADSQPLRHQGSPIVGFFEFYFIFLYSRFLLVIYFIHISVYMSIPISQFIPPPPPPPLPLSPLGVHTFVLYICVSISALQTGSSVPFF